MSKVNDKAAQLFQAWSDEKRALESLRSQVRAAETKLENAANELGKQLVPKGANPSEEFAIWVGCTVDGESFDALVTVKTPKQSGVGKYKIEVREERR